MGIMSDITITAQQIIRVAYAVTVSSLDVRVIEAREQDGTFGLLAADGRFLWLSDEWEAIDGESVHVGYSWTTGTRIPDEADEADTWDGSVTALGARVAIAKWLA